MVLHKPPSFGQFCYDSLLITHERRTIRDTICEMHIIESITSVIRLLHSGKEWGQNVFSFVPYLSNPFNRFQLCQSVTTTNPTDFSVKILSQTVRLETYSPIRITVTLPSPSPTFPSTFNSTRIPSF